MVSKPSQWAADIAKAGGSRYTFHLEAVDTDDLDVVGVCKCIRDHGMQVGVAIKPATPIEALSQVISLVDMVLVMTVEPGTALSNREHLRVCSTASAALALPCSPGFGGQSFMPNMMPKVLSLRTEHPTLDIQVSATRLLALCD